MKNESHLTTKRDDPHGEPVRDRTVVTPLVDIYENRDEILVFADLPGVRQEDVNVHLEKGQLTLEAHRSSSIIESPSTQQEADRQGGARPLEASSSSGFDYSRVFLVPQSIDASKIDAELTAGVLRVRLPKSEAHKPRRIEIKSA